MSDYSNSTIPHSSIEEMCTDIRHTLGLPNTTQWNQPGWLCCSDRVNKWSRHKPIFFKLNGSTLTTEDDHGIVTGFCEIGTTFEHIAILDYKIPAESRRDVPLRWTDFTGYKHKAPKQSAYGSIILAGANQSTPLTVQFDTCEMSVLNLTNGCNAICAIEKVPGGHKVVGYRYLTADEVRSQTPTRYQFDIPYTTPNYASTTTYNKDFYLCFGSGEPEPGVGGIIATPTARYIVGDPESDDCKATVAITVRIPASPNNPLQWAIMQSSYDVIGHEGIELGPTPRINWSKWEVWYRDDAEGSLKNLNKVRITGLAGSFPSAQGGASIDIEYQNPNTGAWGLLKRISQVANTDAGGNWGHDLGRGDFDISGFSTRINKFRIRPTGLT